MPDEIDLLRMFRDELSGPSSGAWDRARAAVAAARSEEVPARHGRRPALRRPGAAAVAVAALAAGITVLLAVAVPGGSRHRQEGAVVSTAYVLKHVAGALSAAAPGEIAHMTITIRGAAASGGGTAAEEWSFGGQWRTVTYSADARPAYDEGVSAASVYTVVSYRARAWARRAGVGELAPQLPTVLGRGLLPSGLGRGPGLRSGSPVTVPGFLRHAVSHGSLAEAGRQRVDGIEAIKLTSPPGSLLSETIWVSPRTYLPVRVTTQPVPGQSGLGQTADITWLPPTGHNLAKLTVPIPGGFRERPLAQVTRPGPGLGPQAPLP